MKPDQSPPLASHLRPALSEAELSAGWASIESSRRDKVQQRARRIGAGLALVACAAALALAFYWPRSNGELLMHDGQTFRKLAQASEARLTDDSRIVTATGAAVEVLENSKSKLALHLVRGSARFEVTPGTGRHWSVEAGELTVEVTGTVFTVDRARANTRVTVERGTVIVRGARVPDGVRRVTAGEELVVGPLAEAEPEPPLAPGESPKVVEAPASPQPAAPAVVAPARQGPVTTAAAVMAQADRLRRDGRTADAVALLASVTERWPASPEAPLAALTAANLLSDTGERDAAHHWYRRALELGLSGPLAENARQALEAGPTR